MNIIRELRPGRDFLVAMGAYAIATGLVLAWPVNQFPAVHTVLDTSNCLTIGLLALLLWDLGWRTGETLVRFKAIVFAVAALLALVHVLTALEISSGFPELARIAEQWRPGTWPPIAYLLPLGLGAAVWARKRQIGSNLSLGLALLVAAAGLLILFENLPRYTPPWLLGMTRPSLILVPLLWIPVCLSYWNRRQIDRIAHAVAFYSIIAAVAQTVMLFSQAPADRAAMIAHLGMVIGNVYLLFCLTQMGTLDTARRMRAERDLALSNDVLETRVLERTQQLEATNDVLRNQMAIRELAERKTSIQLERLHLLRQITHAISERQDLESIYQVVVASLEDHLSVDCACMGNFDQVERKLTVARVGPRSLALARVLELTEGASIPVDENGLKRCVHGELVHEPDLSDIDFPFARKLTRAGLGSLVLAPLMVEQRSGVFGVLIIARIQPRSFSSTDCEFLSQLSEQVAIATHQAQLHLALKNAYDELRETQQAILQQERLRALGQMASGIAHDINNAISPATLYVESILERDSSLNERTRQQLEIVQRAIGDVAQTVGRMGEFYRQRETQVELHPINVNVVLDQIPDLTRARWSNMALASGTMIQLRVEKAPEAPTIAGIESEVREALINLVFNAADAMPQGGTITLRCRIPAGNRRSQTRSVIVEVCDDGSGMDEKTRSRCLEPFFTTKGDRGSGLGLAMVYGIAQRHGAELQIDSELGKGTTIRLVFPNVAPKRDSATERSVVGPTSPMRILIIDDDPLLISSLRDALEYEGHKVVASHGGQAGIDAFMTAQQRKDAFPVVITDLGMPHIDGRQVAAAIKSAAPETLVIMLTGWGQRMAETDDLPPHVDCLLGKPPNMWAVREALSRVSAGPGKTLN